MNRRIGPIAGIPILAMTMAAIPLCALADPFQTTDPVFGGLLDYDLSATGAGDPAAFGVLLDVTLSDGWGSIRSSVAARGTMDEAHAVRLDSAYTRELQNEPIRLTFGDAVLQGGDWAMPLRFGGITIAPASGRGPAPAESAAPIASIESFLSPSAGADDYAGAILPLANATKRDPASAMTPPPVAIGSGQMDFAVRDAPATEQLAALPKRSGLQTLREGEADSHYELGLLRRDYGVGSFNYGDPVGAITLRYGITDDLTGETHAMAALDTQAAGFGLAWAMSAADRLTLSGATSKADAGTGMVGRLAFGHDGAGWDASLGYQMATDAFAQPGWDEPADRITRQAQASGGIELGDYGDLTLGYSLQDRGDDSRDEIASFVLDMPLLEDAHLVAVGAMSRTDGSASIGFSLTIPLGGP